MLKFTLWFDRFDNPQKQYEQLSHFLSLYKDHDIEITIVSAAYSKELYNLINENKNKFSHFSFSNLNEGTIIKTENGVEIINKLFQSTSTVITENDNKYQFGSFEVMDLK